MRILGRPRRQYVATAVILALVATYVAPLLVNASQSDARLVSSLCRGWAENEYGDAAAVESRTAQGDGAWRVTGVFVAGDDGTDPEPRRWACEVSGVGEDVLEGRVTLVDEAAA